MTGNIFGRVSKALPFCLFLLQFGHSHVEEGLAARRDMQVIKIKSSIKVISLALFLGIICSVARAGSFDLEERTLAGGRSMRGCFSKPCEFPPRVQNLFLFMSGGSIIRQFDYVGKSGEKTLIINREYPTDSERIYLDFARGTLYPLMPAISFDCGDNDLIYLKMIDLKGSILKFQIQLPECLKRNK